MIFFFMYNVAQLSAYDYLITMKKSGVEHSVNMLVGHCTCVAGRTGGPCKHQAAVAKYYNTTDEDADPVIDDDVKSLLRRVAAGRGIGMVHRDVSEVTREKLLDLFRQNHRPAEALRMLKQQLQVEHRDNFEAVASDRARCPDIGYCWR